MRRISLMVLTLAALITTSAFAQQHVRGHGLRLRFSDGAGHGERCRHRRRFQSYVAILNPTSSAFSVTATLYDSDRHEAQRADFARRGRVEDVHELSRRGLQRIHGRRRGDVLAVPTRRAARATTASSSTPRCARPARATATTDPAARVRRFELALVRAGSHRRLQYAHEHRLLRSVRRGEQREGHDPRQHRQADDRYRHIEPGRERLAADAVSSIVSGGYVQFDPTDSAVCYAVVVDNATNDGRFISAAEYRP